MGTTRIKVIDLSSSQKAVKTSRKHAEKLTGVAKIKETKVSKVSKVPKEEKAITEGTEKETESTESVSPAIGSVPSKPSRSIERGSLSATVPSVIREQSAPKVAKPSLHHKGKKYQQAQKMIDSNKTYAISEALDLLEKSSYTKFDPTVEIHMNVTDKNIRGNVNFPHAVGGKSKDRRFLVFADKDIPGPHWAKQDGVSVVQANEKTITDIETGKLKPGRDFDQVIAHPKFMPQIAKIAKILGPAGMMPNPKNGTITDNPATAIDKSRSAGLEFKTDPTAPIIHTQIGKLSTKPPQLEENLNAIVSAIGLTKIKKAFLTTTMSPSIKVDLASLHPTTILRSKTSLNKMT